MPSIFTLSGASLDQARKGRPHTCKSVYNPRTKRHTRLCYVGKSKKFPTGWRFVKS